MDKVHKPSDSEYFPSSHVTVSSMLKHLSKYLFNFKENYRTAFIYTPAVVGLLQGSIISGGISSPLTPLTQFTLHTPTPHRFSVLH
jgi:hypothetical protein